MNTQFSYHPGGFIGRARRSVITGVAALLCLVSASMAAVSVQGVMRFTGGGFGPTREAAVQQATWDAQESASAYQFFTCVMVGEPLIFPGPDPKRHRNFSAEVTLECTP